MALNAQKGGMRGCEMVFALWMIGVFVIYVMQFKAILGALFRQFGLT